MTVLFLYTELADYFIKSCENLSETEEVHIIRWPVNKEAPFVFSFSEKLKVYEKNNYTFLQLEQLIKKINPDILICSGWIDKDYLKLTKPYFKKIPTVLTCDTHWSASIKQYIAIVLSRFFLLNKFTYSWVPGKKQSQYVSKLGFKQNKIKTGFYCCDLEKFNSFYKSQLAQKKNKFPKRFLFVGRYYEFKGIKDLWEAFTQLQIEAPNEWELWCLGTGNTIPPIHEKIKHFGFVQPNNLSEITHECGVFVLPSHFEPWGVVVQEYAASGFPIVTSAAVGSSEIFLENGSNGYSFEAKNIKELKEILKKIITLSDSDLIKMSMASHLIAQKITPKKWSDTILEIYNEFNTN
ncbi:glycosyltransferase family 4 protein [Sediminibacterium sp.]|uniref:glycosyltransferase family 4 protein n=1 Tax=Sediminibacterium sp. TaxID=1917865 RepID=UPI00271DE9E7|nr:glycosyltransferase [Sediminibacterium sp.]MDO9000575.1 glycosyltransferase [Bacteroidota bacterium]MDP3146857.1 glycosyltransferase [Bacteroidota bacterium]MDP3567597.1 glycosyltransferase [Sediminibacterium sp.]